jgi:hypothetical protein
MIDLLRLPPDEAERLAYAEGFTGTAQLFARIVDLEQEVKHLQDEICRLESALMDAQQ